MAAAKAVAAGAAEQQTQGAKPAQPSPAAGKAAGSTAAGVGPSAVGKAVKVFWPDEDKWFTGDITGKRGGFALV